jgi:acyl-CoA-binding protein
MVELKNLFDQAAEDVKKLSSRPDNQTLLELYALFKQSTDGDVSGARPGMLDVKGRAKFDAWAKKKGISSETAMKDYIALVTQLIK